MLHVNPSRNLARLKQQTLHKQVKANAITKRYWFYWQLAVGNQFGAWDICEYKCFHCLK